MKKVKAGLAETAVAAIWASALLGSATFSAFAADTAAFQMQSLKEIRERGVVMQRWETSCAAASVATVLSYGFQDPLSERQAVAGMLSRTDAEKVKQRGGFSLLDMKRLVEDRGYSGAAYQGLAFEDLRLFHAPIVPISVHGLNHYVVLNAVSGDEVLIADPAFGNRSLPLTHFEKIWLNGLAFVVTPAPRAAR